MSKQQECRSLKAMMERVVCASQKSHERPIETAEARKEILDKLLESDCSDRVVEFAENRTLAEEAIRAIELIQLEIERLVKSEREGENE